MPNPRYYPQQREQKPTARDQALAGLNAPEQQSGLDPSALMQMLSHLYGIQQGQAETGLHQQDLALKQHLADGEDAYHTAQSQALQRHMPEGFQYLPPEMQNFAFGQAYPEWVKKQADDAAVKAAQKQALMEQDKATQARGNDSPASNMRPGQRVAQAISQVPNRLSDYNDAFAGQTGGFLDDLMGSPVQGAVSQQQAAAHAQTLQDVHNYLQTGQAPSLSMGDKVGNWAGNVLHPIDNWSNWKNLFSAPSQTNSTPPPVYKPVQFMPQERPLRIGF